MPAESRREEARHHVLVAARVSLHDHRHAAQQRGGLHPRLLDEDDLLQECNSQKRCEAFLTSTPPQLDCLVRDTAAIEAAAGEADFSSILLPAPLSDVPDAPLLSSCVMKHDSIDRHRQKA